MSPYWYESYLFHLCTGFAGFYALKITEHFSATKCNSSARTGLMCWRQREVPWNKSSAAGFRQGLFSSDNTSCDYTERFRTQTTAVSSTNPWDKMKCIKHVDFINLPSPALGQRYIQRRAQQALSPLYCYSSALSGFKMNVSKSSMCGANSRFSRWNSSLAPGTQSQYYKVGRDSKVGSRNIAVGLEACKCKKAPVSDGLVASPPCWQHENIPDQDC